MPTFTSALVGTILRSMKRSISSICFVQIDSRYFYRLPIWCGWKSSRELFRLATNLQLACNQLPNLPQVSPKWLSWLGIDLIDFGLTKHSAELSKQTLQISNFNWLICDFFSDCGFKMQISRISLPESLWLWVLVDRQIDFYFHFWFGLALGTTFIFSFTLGLTFTFGLIFVLTFSFTLGFDLHFEFHFDFHFEFEFRFGFNKKDPRRFLLGDPGWLLFWL